MLNSPRLFRNGILRKEKNPKQKKIKKHKAKRQLSNENCRFLYGGDEEDRTLDLTDANRTLSQLSYAPMYSV